MRAAFVRYSVKLTKQAVEFCGFRVSLRFRSSRRRLEVVQFGQLRAAG